MKFDPDGVIREQWTPQPLPHAPVVATRAGPEIVNARAPVSPAAPRVTLVDSDELFDQREAQYAEAIEEAIAEDEDGAVEYSGSTIAPWLAACVLAEVDKSVGAILEKLRDETGSLRRSLDSVTASLAASRRKAVETRGLLRAKIRDLETALEAERKERAEEAESWRGELRLLSAELAEQRAVAELRHSRSGQSHRAKVELRLLKKQFEAEAKGNAA